MRMPLLGSMFRSSVVLVSVYLLPIAILVLELQITLQQHVLVNGQEQILPVVVQKEQQNGYYNDHNHDDDNSKTILEQGINSNGNDILARNQLTKQVAQRTLFIEEKTSLNFEDNSVAYLVRDSIEENSNKNNNNSASSRFIKTTTTTTTTIQSLLGLLNDNNGDVDDKQEQQQKQQQQQQRYNSYHHRQLQQQSVTTITTTSLDPSNVTTCASAFVSCQGSVACNNCIASQVDTDVLFGVSSTTKCDTILTSLQRKKLCTGIASDLDLSIFCTLFKECTGGTNSTSSSSGTNSGSNNEDNGNTAVPPIDCTTLTECNFPGINPTYIGDGICNDYIDNKHNTCYNTPICRYDGGDCCSDTCVDVDNRTNSTSIFPCGIDGYICRNPNSLYCDTQLSNSKCKNQNSTHSSDRTSNNNINPNSNNNKVVCTEGTTMYRVLMFDSFGDGWEDTNLTIRNGRNELVFNDQLQYGAYDVRYLCLSSIQPTCYDVSLRGGSWGREISWEIRGMNPGSPSIAYGGAPMTCKFGTAGIATGPTSTCPLTCTGMTEQQQSSSTTTDDDASYKSLKDLQQCIHDTCYIQSDACLADNVCKNCFQDTVPDFCYASETFIALSDCAVCKCSKEEKDDKYCKNKATPDAAAKGANADTGIGCSANDKLASGKAVMTYVTCTNFTNDGILNQLFDNDNFGLIDNFENCAIEYRSSRSGTKSALGCMQLLWNAMYPDPDHVPDPQEPDTTYHPEAIAELAKELFYNYQGFCTCSKEAYFTTSAVCDGYANFKTLLKESIDACGAMDWIDCPAWLEFSRPCQANLQNKFRKIDFIRQPEQCQYVKDSCGGVGKFPTTNRLLTECSNQVDATSWEFYKNFHDNCLPKQIEPKIEPTLPWGPEPSPTDNVPAIAPKDNIPVTPPTAAAATETSISESPIASVPADPGTTPVAKKKYIPPEERGNVKPVDPQPDSTNDDQKKSGEYVSPDTEQGKKKSHWFRNLVLMGIIGYVGYHLYLRRQNFSSYQRLNGIGGGSSIVSSVTSFLENLPVIGRYFGGSGATRSFGGNQYTFSNMVDPDDMYTGLSMESSSSMMMSSTAGMFQPTSLPPGPNSFMGNSMMMGNNGSNNNTNTSGNYAI